MKANHPCLVLAALVLGSYSLASCGKDPGNSGTGAPSAVTSNGPLTLVDTTTITNSQWKEYGLPLSRGRWKKYDIGVDIWLKDIEGSAGDSDVVVYAICDSEGSLSDEQSVRVTKKQRFYRIHQLVLDPPRDIRFRIKKAADANSEGVTHGATISVTITALGRD